MKRFVVLLALFAFVLLPLMAQYSTIFSDWMIDPLLMETPSCTESLRRGSLKNVWVKEDIPSMIFSGGYMPEGLIEEIPKSNDELKELLKLYLNEKFIPENVVDYAVRESRTDRNGTFLRSYVVYKCIFEGNEYEFTINLESSKSATINILGIQEEIKSIEEARKVSKKFLADPGKKTELIILFSDKHIQGMREDAIKHRDSEDQVPDPSEPPQTFLLDFADSDYPARMRVGKVICKSIGSDKARETYGITICGYDKKVRAEYWRMFNEQGCPKKSQ